MTIEELNELYHLTKEIEFLKNRIEELTVLSSSSFENEIRGEGISDSTGDYAIKRIELLKDLKDTLVDREEEEKKLLDYIKGISNSEIRVIMELRFISGMTWKMIAKELSPKGRTMDESGFRKKCYNFVNLSDNSHTNVV